MVISPTSTWEVSKQDGNKSTVDATMDSMFGTTDMESPKERSDIITNVSNFNESFFALNVTYTTDKSFVVGALDSKTATIIVTIVSLVALLTVLGNIAIILCIARNRNMLTIYNIYAASLACADLLVGIVVMSSMSVYTFHGYWPLGDDFCTVWVVFDFTCCTVSMLHLDAIAFDRFKSVTSPLLYRTTFTKSRAVKISVTMWFLGFTLWVPPVLWFRLSEKQQGILVEGDCYFIPDRYYILVQVSAAYYTPIIFMVVVYVLLFCALHRRQLSSTAREKKAQEIDTVSRSIGHINEAYIRTVHEASFRDQSSRVSLVPGENESSTDTSISSISRQTKSAVQNRQGTKRPKLCRKDSEKAKISAQNRRCITTLGAIIAVFLICWLPFVSFWPIAAFCETCISAEMYEASYWMAYANSFVNPYIYFLLNKDFRSAFFNIFRRKGRRDSLHTIKASAQLSNVSSATVIDDTRISQA